MIRFTLRLSDDEATRLAERARDARQSRQAFIIGRLGLGEPGDEQAGHGRQDVPAPRPRRTKPARTRTETSTPTGESRAAAPARRGRVAKKCDARVPAGAFCRACGKVHA